MPSNGPLANTGMSQPLSQAPSPPQGPSPSQSTPLSNSRTVEPVGPHPTIPQPGSAFTSLSPASPAQPVQQPSTPAMPPASTNTVSNATYQAQPGTQAGMPLSAPYSMSALGSGKPKRPVMPSAQGTGMYSPEGAGTPPRGTPPSSGPPTPAETPTPLEKGSHQGYPSPGQDSQGARPLTSRRRQYPAQV